MLSDSGGARRRWRRPRRRWPSTAAWPRPAPTPSCPISPCSLNNLGTMLSELGRREEALAAAEEAVTLPARWRGPPRRLPARSRESLNNLGQQAERSGAAGGGAGGGRGGGDGLPRAGRDPPRRLPARSGHVVSTTSANRLSDSGRREEALAAAEEAVTIYRELAAAAPRRLPARSRGVAQQPRPTC